MSLPKVVISTPGLIVNTTETLMRWGDAHLTQFLELTVQVVSPAPPILRSQWRRKAFLLLHFISPVQPSILDGTHWAQAPLTMWIGSSLSIKRTLVVFHSPEERVSPAVPQGWAFQALCLWALFCTDKGKPRGSWEAGGKIRPCSLLPYEKLN